MLNGMFTEKFNSEKQYFPLIFRWITNFIVFENVNFLFYFPCIVQFYVIFKNYFVLFWFVCFVRILHSSVHGFSVFPLLFFYCFSLFFCNLFVTFGNYFVTFCDCSIFIFVIFFCVFYSRFWIEFWID